MKRLPAYAVLLPLLLLNALCWPYLPAAYQPEVFLDGVPTWITLPETIGRVVVFGLPVVMHLRLRRSPASTALLCVGVLIYTASWAAQILLPDSAWSTSLVGFTAPAWTPALWLAGLSLTGDFYGRKIRYNPLYYGIPSLFFLCAHVGHATWVWWSVFGG